MGYDNGRRNMIMEYFGDRKGSYAIKIRDRIDGRKGSWITLPEEGISDMIGYCKDIDNGTKEHREIETFSFSTKKKKFKIYVREEGYGSYIEISEITNGRVSSIYVEKSALETFISSIEMVAKQKEGVTLPRSGSVNDRNISMEYYGGRKGYYAINIHDRGDGQKGTQISLPMDGISDMIGYCKD